MTAAADAGTTDGTFEVDATPDTGSSPTADTAAGGRAVSDGVSAVDAGGGPEVSEPSVDFEAAWTRCDFAPSFHCALVRADGELVAVSVDHIDDVLAAYDAAGVDAAACGEDDCAEAMAHCLHDQCKVGDNCLGMDSAACGVSPSCRPVLALEPGTLCLTDDYEPAYDDGVTREIGCVPVADDYGAAPLCAVEDGTDEVSAIFEPYTPAGWTPTEAEACCAPLNAWCQGLSQAECAAQPLKCQPVMAAPAKGVCAEDAARVEGFADTWIGCFGNAEPASWAAPECVQDIISGNVYASPPGMAPPSHEVVAEGLCCGSYDGCVLGDAVPPARFCVRGFEDGGDWVFSDFAYLNMVLWSGDCSGSSCPWVVEAPCTKTVEGEVVTLDATLCVVESDLEACPEGACKAPFTGGCGTHDVYDGDWIVTAGGLQVELTVPSTVPAESTCDEPGD